MDFELLRWGDEQIHLYYEDSLNGKDIDIVLDCARPCVDGKRVDLCRFLRNLFITLEAQERTDQIGKGPDENE